MNDPMQDAKQLDASAVAAVRQGDAERYRELVERHERRVYAVAWSRLGDAALAEDATQEAFISAYRRLWLLGDGTKFSGWITAIVRNAAINMGLRHRRELKKRERWAFEHGSSSPENPGTETDPIYSPEMLRQTLAELPASHRECLVLFYLEGKSGSEAAKALGISESAFRVRLLRARAMLRSKIEGKLESALERLRPANSLVPAIMASVLASSSAKAATAGGAGAAILATLAKFTPLKWLFLLWPVLLLAITMIPAWFLQRWQRREERRNFRDPQGFRAKLYEARHEGLAGIALGLLTGALAAPLGIGVALGVRWVFFVVGLAALGGALLVGRRLQINRSFPMLFQLASLLVACAIFLAIALRWLPVAAGTCGLCIAMFPSFIRKNLRSLRMDYSLFIRANQGILESSEPAVRSETIQLGRNDLRQFARFLAERQLVIDFRWKAEGLVLFLPTAMHSPLPQVSWLWGYRKHSCIRLGWDGTACAHCSTKDFSSLQHGAEDLQIAALEERVSNAVSQAWQHFRNSRTAEAERAIGQIPDSEIFVVPPSRTSVFRSMRIVGAGMLALSLLAMCGAWFFTEELSGFKPVSITDIQAKEFISLVSTNPNPLIKDATTGHYTRKSFKWDPNMALFTCMILPEPRQFEPRQLQVIRESISEAFASEPVNKARGLEICFSPLAKRALVHGWINWSDMGITPREVSEKMRIHPELHQIEFKTDFLLAHERAWSWVKKKSWDVQRVGQYTCNQLRWLAAANCLDLVDREELIQQILSVQTLSATPPNGVPIHDWEAVHGLFFTPCYPALQDTYYSVAALEMLGGLNRMDREACIEGILRVHRGKGFFQSPSSGSYNEYHIDGSARDTIAAYEILCILGALDRVRDLERWEFRTDRRHVGKDEVTWNEIEAWEATKRLKKALADHKADPSKPYDSLIRSNPNPVIDNTAASAIVPRSELKLEL